MAFTGVTATSIVGDSTTGVQSMFPKFTFDTDSRPSLSQVMMYASTAINRLARVVRMKGYDPATIVADEDIQFCIDIIQLTVACDIHAALDQFKDPKNAGPRQDQLNVLLAQLNQTEDPFPTVERAQTSAVTTVYPTQLTRIP